jgi:integrase
MITTHNTDVAVGSANELEPIMLYTELRHAMARTYEPFISARPPQRLKNLQSALSAFLKFHQINESDPVDAVFETAYEAKLALFLAYLRDKGLSQQSIRDKKSQLRAWRALFHELALPPDMEPAKNQLQTALRRYFPKNGTIKGVARAAGISFSTLRCWLNGAYPNIRARPSLERLEHYFSLEKGTLTSLVVWCTTSGGKQRGTPPVIAYRTRLAEAVAMPYALKHIPPNLKAEWHKFLIFKTTPSPAPLKRQKKGTWRMRSVADSNPAYCCEYSQPSPQTVCVSAKLYWELTSRFLGFLALPCSKGGLGLPITQVSTLAHLTNGAYISAFIGFMCARAEGRLHTGINLFAQYIKSLVHPITGFITQSPSLGEKIGLNETEWCTACQSMFEAMKDVMSMAQEHKQFSRDPWEPIQHLIALRNPLVPVIRAIEIMKTEAAHQIPGSKLEASLTRDILLIQLLVANPLRMHNLQVMRYKLDGTGNLFKAVDGSWRIRFPPDAFKNARGAAKNKPYEMTVDKSVWPTIESWLFKHRLVLEIVKTDFVFISSNPKGQGGLWETLNNAVERATRRYIEDCPGFGPHSFRHLVATTLLKQSPKAYVTVATLLHDKLETVMTNYSHLCIDDGFHEWREILSSMLDKQVP